ncbi:mitosis inhibitor protein kinase swe1 [Coemansia sp. RSA 2559]|nr:mitosis inhibitor protein kinase swe1 [Coemansia sp. RSA 2559]KAJ2865181.1 mitosis inhibitor protein kinase swe1 [Coemansia erecta]
MSNTPHRPAARRALRKHGSKGDTPAAPANHPSGTRSSCRRKNAAALRSYASFPALVSDTLIPQPPPPPPPAFNINELGGAQRVQASGLNTKRASIGGRRRGLHASLSSEDPDDFDLDTPPFSRQASAALASDSQMQRTPSGRRRHEYSQQSLLGCLTPTPARTMDSPAGMHSLHSLSPSPSPTPYHHKSRTTHRRLTFSPAEVAAAAAAAASSGSVAGPNRVIANGSPAPQPSTMFTPPATKLVRPDPSVFTSTGLLSKKQRARARSSSNGDGNDSFVTPETPCKRAGALVDSAGNPAESTIKLSNNPRPTEGRARAHSGMATPNAAHHLHGSALKPHLDMDPFRLGKHRNTSTDSLRRTRKKAHIGLLADDMDDMNSLLDTPCRPRQNTLVDDDFMHRPPPGFRIPPAVAAEGSKSNAMLGGPSSSFSASSSSSSAANGGRPLPPSFAPQHQMLIQSLAADNLVDPEMAPWDTSNSAGSRLSWAAASDAGSVSSAVTLAPASRSPVLMQEGALADDGGEGSAYMPAMARQQSQSNNQLLVQEPKRQRMPLFHKSNNCGGIFDVNGSAGGGNDKARSSRFFDAMELDFELGRNDGGNDDDDDVFSPVSRRYTSAIGSRHRRGKSAGALSTLPTMGAFDGGEMDGGADLSQSERIMPAERPQMPQIVQGCATNYPHFLGREYFWRSDHSLPFLAPTSEYLVDGLGYVDYFEHNFEIISRAGEGNFSSVHSVRSLDDGQMYAVKKTRQPFTGRQERARRLREVEVLWTAPQCAGIVRLIDAWEQAGHLYMQFELCERGSLAAYLDERAHVDERVSEAHAWAILAHAAYALNRLHECGVAHLDIKPANFLLGSRFGRPGAEQDEGWLKLADFGHAVRLPHEPLAWVEEGDREYMAPEVLRGVYTKAADVFSLGMMLLEITADIVLPDNGVDWHKLREGCFDDQSFVDLPYSYDLIETIKLMLHPDPARRPSLAQILSLSQCSIYTSPPLPSAARSVEDDFAQVSVRERCNGGYLHPLLPQRPQLMARASTAGADGSPLHTSVHPMTTRSATAAAAAVGTPPRAAAPPKIAGLRGERRRGGDGAAALARRTASAPGPSPPSSSRGSAQTTAIAH